MESPTKEQKSKGETPTHPSAAAPTPGTEPPSNGAGSEPEVPPAAVLLPQLAQSLVLLSEKVEALGTTLREVHADMAALKAQYGVLAAAAQGCASYGVQMTVTFTPQPLQAHRFGGIAAASAPPPLPHAPFPVPAMATSHAPHTSAPLAPLFVDTAVATRTSPPQTGPGATRATPPRGHAKAQVANRHGKRTSAQAATSSDSGGGPSSDVGRGGQPSAAKKQRRDGKNKMFVFLDHINNSRVNSNSSDEADGTGKREPRDHGDGELEIVAASSDEDEAEDEKDEHEEDEMVEDAVAETSSEGEEEEEEDDGDGGGENGVAGQSLSSSSSAYASFNGDEMGEPQHRQPIKWLGVDAPVEGKPLNHHLMPEKITKLEQLHIFWQRMKQNIRVEKSGKGCWICTCMRPTPNSYVRKSISGKKFFAHILTYVVWNRTIDVTLPVVQLCGNRVCLNPKHLSQVKDGPLDTDQRTDCLERRTLETCLFSPPCIGHQRATD